jgi:hypothetical protein
VQRLDQRAGLEALAAHGGLDDPPALVVARRRDFGEASSIPGSRVGAQGY